MHAIVMVHKMQSMTLSNHQLLPNKNCETSSPNSGPDGGGPASLQRDSSEQTDETAGSEQQ